MVQKYSEKTTPMKQNKKQKNKNGKGRRQLLGNCVRLSGRMHIEEPGTMQRRAAASVVL